jgi:outer membrane receptor protein involved in Fe transport
VRILAGARYDWLTDRFEPIVPANRPELTATHRAWSPKIGANVKLVESDRQELGGYLSFSRSFKAPTMDQLFDQRSIPVPFPPYSVTTSNALLVPQTGSGVEAGLQHRLELLSGRLVTGWSLSAYQMDMRHELDFDIATLRYINVAESRHRGIEAAANLVAPSSTTAAVTYSLQNAVATNGDNAGRFLRAIPRLTLTARVSHEPARGLSLSVAAVRVEDAPFDNENSRDLPPYTRVDARASYAVGVVRLVGEVRNALDASYNSTGFPDPGGSGTGFYYPAAGRVVSIGAEARW